MGAKKRRRAGSRGRRFAGDGPRSGSAGGYGHRHRRRDRCGCRHRRGRAHGRAGAFIDAPAGGAGGMPPGAGMGVTVSRITPPPMTLPSVVVMPVPRMRAMQSSRSAWGWQIAAVECVLVGCRRGASGRCGALPRALRRLRAGKLRGLAARRRRWRVRCCMRASEPGAWANAAGCAEASRRRPAGRQGKIGWLVHGSLLVGGAGCATVHRQCGRACVGSALWDTAAELGVRAGAHSLSDSVRQRATAGSGVQPAAMRFARCASASSTWSTRISDRSPGCSRVQRGVDGDELAADLVDRAACGWRLRRPWRSSAITSPSARPRWAASW